MGYVSYVVKFYTSRQINEYRCCVPFWLRMQHKFEIWGWKENNSIPNITNLSLAEAKEIMIVSTLDKTCERVVSHWREEEEAVQFVSGHTHPPSECRQDGECIINWSLSCRSSWTHDNMYGVTVPRNQPFTGPGNCEILGQLLIYTHTGPVGTRHLWERLHQGV